MSAKKILKDKIKIFAPVMLSVMIAAFCFLAVPAGATLGELSDSISSDKTVLNAISGRTATKSGYTVQEIKSDAVTLREYIAPDGIVFAIAWNGLIHPDLTSLLGSYFAQYEEGLKQTPRKRGRRHLQVKSGQVVVEKWGHMRNLQGRAYLPALIPPGVETNDIK